MVRATPPAVGWYGLQSVGGGWRPVTPDEMANILLILTAVSLGAPHVGYWSGNEWEHVEAIDLSSLSK